MFPVVDTGVPPATRQCPCWSSASRGEQGPARRPHQRRQRVSLGTACRPVSNPWVRPAHREREILRPPPSPPRRRRRRPAALPPLAARLAAEPPIPNVGPSGHAQKNRFFASRSRAGHLDSASRPFADRKPLSGESQHVGFSRLGRRGCPLSQFQDWNWFPSPQGR